MLRVWCETCHAQSADPRDCLRVDCPWAEDQRAYDAVEALMSEGYTRKAADKFLHGAKPGISDGLAWLCYLALWAIVIAVAVIAYLYWPVKHAP